MLGGPGPVNVLDKISSFLFVAFKASAGDI